MNEFEALRKYRQSLLENLAKIADEIKRIDGRLEVISYEER